MASCIPRRIGVNLETTSDTYRSFQADLRIGLFYCPETGKATAAMQRQHAETCHKVRRDPRYVLAGPRPRIPPAHTTGTTLTQRRNRQGKNQPVNTRP